MFNFLRHWITNNFWKKKYFTDNITITRENRSKTNKSCGGCINLILSVDLGLIDF